VSGRKNVRNTGEQTGLTHGFIVDLAHAQDIVSSDWEAIVQLSAHLDRALE
jgi:hypothetical protein